MTGFVGRVLDIDATIVVRCAALQVPKPRPFIDTLIAATGLVHNLIVVTRNVADFEPTGVATFNPWIAAPRLDA